MLWLARNPKRTFEMRHKIGTKTDHTNSTDLSCFPCQVWLPGAYCGCSPLKSLLIQG
jgi:hypothetical protein